MKYVLFLDDLELTTRDECKTLLSQEDCLLQPVWFDEIKDSPIIRNEIEIIITRDHKVRKSLLRKYPKLNTISLAFTGYDEANVPFFISNGVKVYYVPDYAAVSVAELNIALTLALLRKITVADEAIRKRYSEKYFEFYPGSELSNKKIGIIGTGKIGIKTAKLFNAFNTVLYGYSRNEKDDFIKLGGIYKSKKELLIESDIIVICLPLDDTTKHFMKAEDFELLNEEKIIINTSRSELIDELALIDTLKLKRIWVGLDITKEPEKINTELSKLNNVIFTPHIGYKTKEALIRLAETAIKNIGRSVRNDNTNCLNEIL